VGKAAARMTVVSVLSLAVTPGTEDALARRFAQLQVFERAREVDGFQGGRLLQSVQGDGRFLVVAEWTSTEAYRGWLESSTREELGAELEPLLVGGVASGELFVDARESHSGSWEEA
jgi:heme-degrading monooxygenase HmoA